MMIVEHLRTVKWLKYVHATTDSDAYLFVHLIIEAGSPTLSKI